MLQAFKEGGSRVELADYSTIISNVRGWGPSRRCLGAGVYRDLDYYQKLGTLVHIPVTHQGKPLKMKIARDL